VLPLGDLVPALSNKDPLSELKEFLVVVVVGGKSASPETITLSGKSEKLLVALSGALLSSRISRKLPDPDSYQF